MNGVYSAMWLLFLATATLVTSFRHHSRITNYGSSRVIHQGRYRYIKHRYKYRQEQQNIIGGEKYIGSSTSALSNSVKEALMNDPDFEVFTRLLKQADLEDIESSIGKIVTLASYQYHISLISSLVAP